MPFAASLALAVSLVLNGGAAAQGSTSVSIMPAAQSPKQFVDSYFADAPIMAKIAYCESRYRQYDTDGSIFRGKVNDQDVGIMQVNEYYHSATAEKLGLDLYTIQGNVAYARYLYEKEGTRPWSSSEPCWGKFKTKPSPIVAINAK